MKAKIVALGGDGIGPEVMKEGLKVLSLVDEMFGLDVEVRSYKCGWQYFQKHKDLWEEGAFEACEKWADAVLFGAVGWPGARPKGWGAADGSVVLDLRYGLELFANVRPVKLLPGVPILLNKKIVKAWEPEDVDLVIVRENLEDLYFSAMSMPYPTDKTQVQVDERLTSRKGSERIVRFAFEEALRRKDSRTDGHISVTCVDKSNAFPGCALFRDVFDKVSKDFPMVHQGKAYVDAFQLALLHDPSKFDIIVTPNFIGDIVTDLAAVLQGGLGMAPSANIGREKAMFEPVHGSAPDIAGKQIANPTGMILSVDMMLDWLGRKRDNKRFFKASERIRKAVRDHYSTTELRTPDLGGKAKTTEIGKSLMGYIED